MFSSGQSNLPRDPSIEMLTHMIVRRLCGKEEKVLFVLDDVTETERKNVNTFKRISQIRISLLVTSQISDWEDIGVKKIKIDCFEEEESIKFLKNQLQSTSKDIDHLAGHLQSYPLALQQAVCYIKKFKSSVSTYIEQFIACRKSILDAKIESFSEYDKTLLTVWDMAFNKIRNESKKALLVLGMMAYMDNRFINRKTFLYCPDIDGEFELNELLELLGQYSLIMQRNNEYLEIHSLVQKVIQIHIQNNRFVDDLNPRESLSGILTSISFSIDSDDIRYKDDENLWFVHFFKLNTNNPTNEKVTILINPKKLVNIAKRRHDFINLFIICETFLPSFLEKYHRSKNVIHFLDYLDIHRELLILVGKISIKEMIQFERDFSNELEIEHRSIFCWKIRLSNFLKRKNQKNRAEKINSDLFKLLDKKKGLDDVKLDFCGCSIGSFRGEILLEQIDEKKLEEQSFKIKYFSLCFYCFLRKRDFDKSEKWLMRLEEGCTKYDFSYYEPGIVSHKVWFLYWKSQFNEAFGLLERLGEALRPFDSFFLLKSLLLLKLKKYEEAESVFDGVEDSFSFSCLCLSFIKFLRNDFSGAMKNLEKYDNDDAIEEILNYVYFYEIKWHNFNEKKSSSSINEESKKSLKECVEMKKNDCQDV